MSYEIPPQDGSDPHLTGVDPTSAQEKMRLDDFLHDPSRLRSLLVSPDVVTMQVTTESGGDPEVVHAETTRAQQRAFQEIIAPEGLAEGSRKVVERLSDEAAQMLVASDRLMQDGVTGMKRAIGLSRVMGEDVTQGTRMVYHLRDILEAGGQHVDFSAARSIASRLADTLEQYGTSLRGLGAAHEDVINSIRPVRGVLEDMSTMTRKAHYDIADWEKHAESDPASMYFDGVEDKVAQRGQPTVDNHRDSCEAETTRNEQTVGALKQGCDTLNEEVVFVLRGLQNQESTISELPKPMMLGDMAADLRRAIYAVEQGQDYMRPRVSEMLGVIAAQLHRATLALRGTESMSHNQLQKLEDAHQQAFSLRKRLLDR